MSKPFDERAARKLVEDTFAFIGLSPDKIGIVLTEKNGRLVVQWNVSFPVPTMSPVTGSFYFASLYENRLNILMAFGIAMYLEKKAKNENN